MLFKELVQLDEFREYRRREIEAGADILKQIWIAGDPQYVRGAVDMLSKIIRLPAGFTDAPETKEFMNMIVARDFAEFEARFLRKHLVED
jgi:hypothetical protein